MSTDNSFTIDAIGEIAESPDPGTEQFGIRVVVTSGNGSASSPYSGSGFAYAATQANASTVGVGPGDNVTTRYSLRYLANVSNVTENGDYSTILSYGATSAF
jgi:hypothetical protein